MEWWSHNSTSITVNHLLLCDSDKWLVRQTTGYTPAMMFSQKEIKLSLDLMFGNPHSVKKRVHDFTCNRPKIPNNIIQLTLDQKATPISLKERMQYGFTNLIGEKDWV